jgi:antitoxin component YwqK of YwqJK toxin-antitoxin module
MRRGHCKDGKREGLWEEFHENGQSSAIQNYKDGEWDGLWECFYENGQLEKRGNLKDGKREGLWEEFHENGQLKCRESYIDGVAEGFHEEFYENGQLEIRGNLKDGKQNGLIEQFYENGQIKAKVNFKDGKDNGPFERFYENGQLESRGHYKDGKANGPFEWFHENGQLRSKVNYKDGKENGPFEYFHENGELKARGHYKYGIKEGLWEWFNENGQLESKGDLNKDGKEEGLWEWFHENGQLEGRGHYKDGIKKGIWEWFDENGQLTAKPDYDEVFGFEDVLDKKPLDKTLKQFGLGISNPIQATGIGEGFNYLDRVVTDKDQQITYKREGSHATDTEIEKNGVVVPAMVDRYGIYDPKKNKIATFYLCPSAEKNSTSAPKGFKLRTAASVQAEPLPGINSYVEKVKSMSSAQLVLLARKQGIDLPPDFDREAFIRSIEKNPNPRVNNQKQENTGCFIATAVLGSYEDPMVQELRKFRDDWILKKAWGKKFVSLYYRYGPIVARRIESNLILKRLARFFIVRPAHLFSKLISKL